MVIFKIVVKNWKLITVCNNECNYELFRDTSNIKCFLKQEKMVNNITFNGIKLMAIFKITISYLKYVEKTEEH